MMQISRKVQPEESDLNLASEWLGNKISGYPDELQGPIHMAGVELLENAIKYHMDKHINVPVLFELSINDTISLKVTNRIVNAEDSAILEKLINRINSGIDPRIQYMHRLKEIMENRVINESRLGLLRIAGEGNFCIAYEQTNDKITILAEKYYKKQRNNTMESLVTKDFSIEVQDKDPVEIIWKGKSRDLNPSMVLDGYLDELIDHLLDKDVLVDFSVMESLNSSTIPPILTFLSNLEKKRIRTTVQYSKDIYWQKASFKPLNILIRDFKFVKIIPV